MTVFKHTPVMVGEVIRFLNLSPQGCYIDGTIGGGGHARAILTASAPSGKLLGIDRDQDAVLAAQEELKIFGNRVKVVQGDFSKLGELMSEAEFDCANGIVLDLGVSSYQLDQALRGFGFGKDGPLDMRMNSRRGSSAAEIIRDIDEKELADIIYEYGEERYARRIARGIVNRRSEGPILTTGDLADAVISSIPAPARKGRIHPATRTFQAIRIFVNDELGELKRFLDFAPEILCPAGKLVIISYHSLEDRLVKNAFRQWKSRGGFCVITKKVVTPGVDEMRNNPRSRSAKLRALERIKNGSCCC